MEQSHIIDYLNSFQVQTKCTVQSTAPEKVQNDSLNQIQLESAPSACNMKGYGEDPPKVSPDSTVPLNSKGILMSFSSQLLSGSVSPLSSVWFTATAGSCFHKMLE